MAKQTINIQCLFAWLRERKCETGLTKKAKSEADESVERPHTMKPLKSYLAAIIVAMILAFGCGPSKEKVLELWQQKRDSIAKHDCDSVKARLDFIIEMINAGASEAEANKKADALDSLMK